MAITAVSSISVTNNRHNAVHFGSRKNKGVNPEQNGYDKGLSSKASGMVTIPTALFLALASSSFNAQAENPVESTSGVEPVRTEYVQHSNKVQLDKKPYRLIRNIPVKEVIKTTCFGQPYNLIFAGGKHNDNVVDIVYFAPATYDGTRKGKNGIPEEVLPPIVTMMRLHDLGDSEKTFMTVVTNQALYNKDYDIWLDTRSEQKILPDGANPLIDLISGDTKWEYKGNIKCDRTDSPKYLPIKEERIY